MPDPFVIPPQLWFGLLCEGFEIDQRGRFNVQAVFNQVTYVRPPEATGIRPHGPLHALLVVGFTRGMGNFAVDVDLCDLDGNVLWTRPEGQWTFVLTPGAESSAVLMDRVQYWFSETGRYYYRLRLHPIGSEERIHFEVAEQPGPVVLAPGHGPGQGQ